MPKPLHVLAVCSQITLSALVAATSAHAQSPPVVFQGLEHNAVGGATLRIDRGALEVAGLGSGGTDGVAVKLGEATSWTARFTPTRDRALPLSLAWSAHSDGQRISTALIRQAGDKLEVSALFTGATTPTYSAQVYSGGQLMGATGRLSPTARIDLGGFSYCDFSEICRILLEFHNTANSACEWRLVLGTNVVVGLPGGATLTGNELRLVEEVRPAGHYPYLTFDTMLMQSNAYSFAIFAETVR